MISGIGVDIVQVRRMKRWLEVPGLPERYFHQDELSASFAKGKRAGESLAGRFAAKEAFGKALGTGLAGIELKDIIVVNNRNGKPDIKVTGTALSTLGQNGADTVHLSISHERDNAVAMVVLECRDRKEVP